MAGFPLPADPFVSLSHAFTKKTPFGEVDMHGPNVAIMRRFNHQHAEVWFVVQNAFGRLKGPWHVLRMISAHPSLEVRMQEACAALHNFLEARGGGYDENLDVAMEQLNSTPMVAGGNDSMFFAGQARRVEIVKALGLPLVDTEAMLAIAAVGGGTWRMGWMVAGARRSGGELSIRSACFLQFHIAAVCTSTAVVR